MKRKKLKRLIAQIVREELSRPPQSPIHAAFMKEALAAFETPLTIRRPQTIYRTGQVNEPQVPDEHAPAA